MSDPVGIVCLILCEVTKRVAVLIEVTVDQRVYKETNTATYQMQKEDIVISVVYLLLMSFNKKHKTD